MKNSQNGLSIKYNKMYPFFSLIKDYFWGNEIIFASTASFLDSL